MAFLTLRQLWPQFCHDYTWLAYILSQLVQASDVQALAINLEIFYTQCPPYLTPNTWQKK